MLEKYFALGKMIDGLVENAACHLNPIVRSVTRRCSASKKTPWREGLETDSFVFRISKNFEEFDLRVIIEHKVLESGETVTNVMTGKEDCIPEEFRDLHCCSLTWKRGVKVDIHELAKGFIADYFRDYHVLNGDEWIPTSSWKQDIGWTYSF